jgi:hypothetical protein
VVLLLLKKVDLIKSSFDVTRIQLYS